MNSKGGLAGSTQVKDLVLFKWGWTGLGVGLAKEVGWWMFVFGLGLVL